MTTHRIQSAAMWIKNLRGYLIAGLAAFSLIVNFNLFLLDQVSAQSPSPSINVALEPNNSGTINVYSDTATLDDIEAIATILKTKTHTLAIGAKETTNDDGTMSTPRNGCDN